MQVTLYVMAYIVHLSEPPQGLGMHEETVQIPLMSGGSLVAKHPTPVRVRSESGEHQG